MQKTMKRKRHREYKCVFHVTLLPIREYKRHRLHVSWAVFHSFIRWSTWSNSHLNNIHSNKTGGQTHRRRVTDKKHFHFKYNKISYTRRRGISLEMRTMKHLGSFPWNSTWYRHTTQTQFRQKQRNELRVKGADPRPSLMYFKKAQSIPPVFQKKLWSVKGADQRLNGNDWDAFLFQKSSIHVGEKLETKSSIHVVTNLECSTVVTNLECSTFKWNLNLRRNLWYSVT